MTERKFLHKDVDSWTRDELLMLAMQQDREIKKLLTEKQLEHKQVFDLFLAHALSISDVDTAISRALMALRLRNDMVSNNEL